MDKQPPKTFKPNWMNHLDTRTTVAKEMRERFTCMTSDLGGLEHLSYAQKSLVERALWLEHWLRTQESELASGEPFDVGKWVQAANSLQGILSKLGLERQAKNVTSFQDFITGKKDKA